MFFGRRKALRTIEDGLTWKAGGPAAMPRVTWPVPEGIFVPIPKVDSEREFDSFVEALRLEAAFALNGGAPSWVYLTGDWAGQLPVECVRTVARAINLDVESVGLDIDPATLGPGDVAAYRSVSVDRFGFRLESPYAPIEEPVRRARALGAFVVLEVPLGNQMNAKLFLQTVERAVAASPNQISFLDRRGNVAFGADALEQAGQMAQAAGYRRSNLWTWSRSDVRFDRLESLLYGQAMSLGPGAVSLRPAAFVNPPMARWLDSRFAGRFDVSRAGGRLEDWVAFAGALYGMRVQRQTLECRLARHISSLERLGILDKQGRPATSKGSLEFFHKTTRAALRLTGDGDAQPALAPEPPGEPATAGMKRG